MSKNMISDVKGLIASGEIVITSDVNDAWAAKKNNKTLVIIETPDNRGANLPSCECIVTDITGIDDDFILKMYQRHNDIPWTIAVTERLIIREITPEDIVFIEGELIKKALCLSEREIDTDILRAYIETAYHIWGYGLWLLVEKSLNRVIGIAGIGTKNDLGYEIYPKYRRKGYGYEACCAICKYAREEIGMEDIYSIISEKNHESIGLAKKLNIRIELA